VLSAKYLFDSSYDQELFIVKLKGHLINFDYRATLC